MNGKKEHAAVCNAFTVPIQFYHLVTSIRLSTGNVVVENVHPVITKKAIATGTNIYHPNVREANVVLAATKSKATKRNIVTKYNTMSKMGTWHKFVSTAVNIPSLRQKGQG